MSNSKWYYLGIPLLCLFSSYSIAQSLSLYGSDNAAASGTSQNNQPPQPPVVVKPADFLTAVQAIKQQNQTNFQNQLTATTKVSQTQCGATSGAPATPPASTTPTLTPAAQQGPAASPSVTNPSEQPYTGYGTGNSGGTNSGGSQQLNLYNQ